MRKLLTALACWLIGQAPAAAEQPTARTIHLSPDGKRAILQLDVLTYNVEGVPTRFGRIAKLAEIGARLDALRRSGDGPDIVLFQEVFSRSAKAAVRDAGYPRLLRGPGRKQRRDLPREGARKGHKLGKGELGVKLVGSGLAIASIYPVRGQAAEPYSRRACAGLDCLSNKGAQFVKIDIPGAPDPLEIFNTHMNAQGSSGVGIKRHLAAHNAQVLELRRFIDEHRDPKAPALLGGDFNMRQSEVRFDAFLNNNPMELVHRYCLTHASCDVRVSWDGDAPWMDTQDLQLFKSGERMTIRPIRVESLFDGRPDSPHLSDHDGFRVIYELSWPVR